MPKLMQTDVNLETYKIAGAGSFQFSAIRPEDLGATEYTLATIVLDITGSVSAFASDLLNMVKVVVESCKKSPRSENLLLRLVTFNYNYKIVENHGFKLLSLIDLNDYKPFKCEGMTALFDASYESIGATLTYSKTLIDQDFNVNGIIFIITDGDDNDSKVATLAMIKKKIAESLKAENIESLTTVLIGINTTDCKKFLEDFQVKANLTQFVDVGDATPQRVAKLAGFVSKSISSTSQALGTGSASAPISYKF
jgi:uncharacterized protein YegL